MCYWLLVIDEGIPIGFFRGIFPLGVKWCEGVDRYAVLILIINPRRRRGITNSI